MSKLTSRGWSSTDATAFMARASGPHTLQWRADVYDSAGTQLATYLPITGGQLVLDSSEPIRRRLTLEVANMPAPDSYDDDLVPFGQKIYLYCRLDLADGTWSAWMKHGEYPIKSNVYERPSQIQTIECTDYSGTVDEYAHLGKRSYGGKKMAASVNQMVTEALPNHAYTLHADDATLKVTVTTWNSDAGSSRWEECVRLCQSKGYECFFDWNGDLVIRKDITDDDNESIPGVGPDIGTVSSPVATIRDGQGGTLMGMSATVTRDGAANGVRYNLHTTVTHREKKNGRTTTTTKDVNKYVQALQTTGPVTWGDRFGRIPLVINKDLQKITDDTLSYYQKRANNLLYRRRGVIRYLDLDAVGCYWLEPDDKVNVRWGNVVEAHYVQRVEFDLSGGSPARVRTRQLSVVDPG